LNNLINVIKQIVKETVEAGKPGGVFYGVVTGVKPLTVSVDQKFELTKMQIVLGKAIAEFPLIVGDRLILLREQGGQKYVCLDILEDENNDT
jgi:hypothetical protein